MHRIAVFLVAFAHCGLAGAEMETDPRFRPVEPMSIQLGVLAEKPFQARFTRIHVTIDRDGRRFTETRSGMIFRDRAGRVRREFESKTVGGEVLSQATIYDPVGQRMHFLNLTSKTAMSAPLMDAAMDSKPGWIYSGLRPVKSEPVERKLIEGIECRKLRLTPGQAEVWISSELGQAVQESVISPKDEYTWSLSAIREAEPETSLFTTPEDFQAMDPVVGSSPGLPLKWCLRKHPVD